MSFDRDRKVNNSVMIQLIKGCTKFLSSKDAEIGKKFFNLNELYAVWNTETDEDYSAEVYEAVVDMFAANVFRPLPPSSYADADDDLQTGAGAASGPAGGPGCPVIVTGGEPTAEATVEFTQTVMAYQAFRAFVDRDRFDADKARPHVAARRFVNGLVHRLNSGDAGERLTVRDTVDRVWATCSAARRALFRAAVDELADFAYGYAPRHRGVDDLLDFFAGTAFYVIVDATAVRKLSRVLIHLLKHQSLLAFKSKLVECARTLNSKNSDLIPQMLTFIKKLWSCHHLKTIVLLHTMIELYEWCESDKWIQLQSEIVCHLSKLFNDSEFQLAEDSMNFWYRILHEDIKIWKHRQDHIKIIVENLIKVSQNHWNEDCVKMARNILKIMMTNNIVTDNCCLEEPEKKFPEEKPNGINYDLLTKRILIPLTHSMALVDTPPNTESIV